MLAVKAWYGGSRDGGVQCMGFVADASDAALIRDTTGAAQPVPGAGTADSAVPCRPSASRFHPARRIGPD